MVCAFFFDSSSRSHVAPILLALSLLAGCASAPPRVAPLPSDLAGQGTILGQEGIRTWGDEKPRSLEWWASASDEEIIRQYSGIMHKEHVYLALSGGGENGAFTAGLLAGWTKRGDRPEFTIVTGVSTGALIAPFAFLGSEYDDEVSYVYTHYAMEDLVERRKVRNIVFNDAVAESTPMQQMIERYMTPEVMGKIAYEYRNGRRLYMGTTNIDAGRSVLWDIGEIANSGEPGALELIRKIMRASASIPVGIPPVVFEVEVDGRTYEELHVDGGVTEQVFLYPIGLDWDLIERRLRIRGTPTAYIIRNGYVEADWETVERKLVPLAGRTIDMLIRTQSIGDLYRMYLATQRDGIDFRLAKIPVEFRDSVEDQSGLGYMKALYHFAYQAALAGYPWVEAPPGLAAAEKTEPVAAP